MDNTKKWSDILEELVQCYVCLEVPKSMIFQCINGHHICNFCKDQVEKCPLCQRSFLSARNLFAEEVVRKIDDIKALIVNEIMDTLDKVQTCKMPSVNSSTMTDPITHEKCKSINHKSTQIGNGHIFTFSYRCLLRPCNKSLQYTQLISHLKQVHKNMFSEVSQSKNTEFRKLIVLRLVPGNYDYAFFINNMGLYFCQITINRKGNLICNLLSTINSKLLEAYQWDFRIYHKDAGVSYDRLMIMSCENNTKINCAHGVHINEERMLPLLREEVSCEVTIRRKED